jgi:NADPH2:quinone reductase
VLGFDAAGVVEAVGPSVTLFKAGDEVWYAGSRARSGTNAELHLVDERIVGRKPRSLDFAQAAAMPLTAITAWEALFERLQLRIGHPQDAGTLLITAGAGGVGSIAIQLARRLSGARIVATASRPQSREQAERLGAHLVIDHRQPLSQALQQAGIRWAERIFSVSHTHLHFAELAKAVAPQGRICVIDDPEPIDVRLLKARCASLHWEAMFTRSGFETPDMAEQGRLLNEVAALVDEGLIRSTHAQTLGRIDAAHLRAAHAAIESGNTIGKITLAGF